MTNDMRSAIAEVFGFPLAEAGMQLVDSIENVVCEADTLDEAESAADLDSLIPGTYWRLVTWHACEARNAAADEGMVEASTDAMDVIDADLNTVIRAAVGAAWQVKADAADVETDEDEKQGACILTGVDGENADDCTTHDHEIDGGA